MALFQDPELWHAWRLLQQLYGIYDAADENEAAARVESFVYAWEAAPIPEFRSVLKALAQWLPEILAFHRCGRITNGRLEGTNNKLGVLKRIAYGFVNADTSRQELCSGVHRWHHEQLSWWGHPTKSRGTSKGGSFPFPKEPIFTFGPTAVLMSSNAVDKLP